MIKVIACDMDGTLLNSQKEFDNDFFDVLNEVIHQNLNFVVASGNQFYHLYNQFQPYSDQLIFISENGAYVTKGKEELYSYTLENQDIEIVESILRLYSEIVLVVCGKKKAYIQKKYRQYKEELDRHFDEYEFVDDLKSIDDKVFKFSVHDPQHCVKNYVEKIRKQLPSHLKIMTSGNEWMDIQHIKVHKGLGMNIVKDYFHVSRDECACFGDQMNDYELFLDVKYGYAMSNAVEKIKEISYQVILSNDEGGVTKKLKEILKGEY